MGLLPTGTLAQTSQQATQLVFGLISPRAEQETRTNWTPFVQRLGLAVGRPIALKIYALQGDLVKAFIGGEIDLAWMGNVPALDVVASGTGGIFAQMVMQDGSVGYQSVLVVPSNSQVRTLKSLLEKASNLRFSDGDPSSTSGHLVPLYFAFYKNGVNNPAAIFKSVATGSHQQNLTKVSKGEADVATANDVELGFLKRDFPELAKGVRVIWESPLIPQSPLLWKTAMPDALKAPIRKFVTGFGASDAGEKQILLAVNGLSRFRPSSNRQLIPIADLEMFKTRQAINNDTSLSPEERQVRISQAIERGSRLELRLKLIPQ